MRCFDWYGDRSLMVVDVALACCAVEFEAAATAVEVAELRDGDRVVVVISGTVTDAVLPVVQELLDQAPGAQVISFGACASSGGPYWDSYAVTKGISQIVEVDVFVPGCPPPPGALVEVLDGLRAEVVA
ncbi:hypothetical protein HJ590_00190 [Naumannella sp. ID2617S]|nr:hypothetical protein [Naumannella sp. ID2617S]